MPTATFRIWRGQNGEGDFRDYGVDGLAGDGGTRRDSPHPGGTGK